MTSWPSLSLTLHPIHGRVQSSRQMNGWKFWAKVTLILLYRVNSRCERKAVVLWHKSRGNDNQFSSGTDRQWPRADGDSSLMYGQCHNAQTMHRLYHVCALSSADSALTQGIISSFSSLEIFGDSWDRRPELRLSRAPQLKRKTSSRALRDRSNDFYIGKTSA